MDPGWRRIRAEHDRRARKRLAGGGGMFREWEATMMFCEIVIVLDGHAEARGLPTPKNHKARRALVEMHPPHLAGPYGGLYGPSQEPALRRARHDRKRMARGGAVPRGARREHSRAVWTSGASPPLSAGAPTSAIFATSPPLDIRRLPAAFGGVARAVPQDAGLHPASAAPGGDSVLDPSINQS